MDEMVEWLVGYQFMAVYFLLYVRWFDRSVFYAATKLLLLLLHKYCFCCLFVRNSPVSCVCMVCPFRSSVLFGSIVLFCRQN